MLSPQPKQYVTRNTHLHLNLHAPSKLNNCI